MYNTEIQPATFIFPPHKGALNQYTCSTRTTNPNASQTLCNCFQVQIRSGATWSRHQEEKQYMIPVLCHQRLESSRSWAKAPPFHQLPPWWGTWEGALPMLSAPLQHTASSFPQPFGSQVWHTLDGVVPWSNHQQFPDALPTATSCNHTPAAETSHAFFNFVAWKWFKRLLSVTKSRF